jgi:two-component system response regulator PilR (NtrC family)
MGMKNTIKKHIFILDDEPKVREVIKETLEVSNYKVSCFGDPVKCLARLRSKKCDLLITDLKMPKKSGFEVLLDVRHQAPRIPVLMMAGYSDMPTKEKAMRAGAVDLIEKPLSKKDILRKIKSIFKEKLLCTQNNAFL